MSIRTELVDLIGTECRFSRHTLIILPEADDEIVAVEEERVVIESSSGQRRHIPIDEIWKVVHRHRLPGFPVLGLVVGGLGFVLAWNPILHLIPYSRGYFGVFLPLALAVLGVALAVPALRRPRKGLAGAALVVSALAILGWFRWYF